MTTNATIRVILATTVLVVAITVGCVRSQSSSPAWSEHYRDSTVEIGLVRSLNGKDYFSVLGAGIIVAPDSRHAFLVTANHVFAEPAASLHELRLRFAWEQGHSFSEDIGVPIEITDPSGKHLWRTLGDGSDIAAIGVGGLIDHHPPPSGTAYHAISFEDFGGDEDLFDGAQVFIYGFPGFVGDARLVRALTRGGIVAWTDPAGASDHPFLVDANIFPGNSGGPVFLVPSGMAKSGTFVVGGKVALLGIISQTYYQTANLLLREAGSPTVTQEQLNINGLGSLGVVEPASKIKRLVEGMM